MSRIASCACFVVAVLGTLADDVFCPDGMGLIPDMDEDHDIASVEVIVAQAALMSVNGSQLFGKINWFHTALVFRQNSSLGESRYWTLEFDSAASGGFFSAIMPTITGENLEWGNLDARFCLRRGLYWGRDHWKKLFQPVMHLTMRQVTNTLLTHIQPLNISHPGEGPQYQTFAVQATGPRVWHRKRALPPKDYMLVHDLTCGDGVAWFLFHAASLNQVPIKKGFRLHVTQVVLKAENITMVDTNNTDDWQAVMKTYRGLQKVIQLDPLWRKPLDLLRSLPVEALYDANTKTYWRLHGNRFPYMHFLYKEIPICSPTDWAVPECLEYLPEDVGYWNATSNLIV